MGQFFSKHTKYSVNIKKMIILLKTHLYACVYVVTFPEFFSLVSPLFHLVFIDEPASRERRGKKPYQPAVLKYHRFMSKINQ